MKYLYIILALLTGLSYWFVRPYVILQKSPQTYITISNLTLNYVLFYMFVGGLAYWVASKRLFKSVKPFKRTILSAGFTLTVAVGVLALLSPWYQIR